MRRKLLRVWCGAVAALALCPATALAGGTDLKVEISGAGRVHEIGTDTPRVDCSGTGGELDCGSRYISTGSTITMEATPAQGWRFDGWTEKGADKFGCTGTGTCSFTAPICVWCTTKAVEVATFERADADADGYETDTDCDDGNAAINPSATEVPDNDVDENCDGVKAHTTDKDGDGFSPPGDCNDDNPGINPAAHEAPDNNVDENCDGVKAYVTDRDGDGYDRDGVPGSKAPYDCDDAASGIHPSMVDIAENGLDEDCSGADRLDLDKDRDGYERPYDCDDAGPGVHPGGADRPRDGVDGNCDGRDADWQAMPVGVEHGVRRSGRGVKLVLLNVKRIPAGSTVRVACKGAGCPRGTLTRRVALNTDVLELKRRFRGSIFRGRATVTVRITHPDLLGKAAALTFHRRGPVDARVTCLAPGTGATVAC